MLVEADGQHGPGTLRTHRFGKVVVGVLNPTVTIHVAYLRTFLRAKLALEHAGDSIVGGVENNSLHQLFRNFTSGRSDPDFPEGHPISEKCAPFSND